MREYIGIKELDSDGLRQLQLKELEILTYFVKFCDEHNLRYYLAGGTLLGAVRHKGFIPWDDDVDLHMPRPDYDKLPELWLKYANIEKYELAITDVEKNYRHHAYSIVDKETTFIEYRNINDDIAQGVKIDVIPLDGAPQGKIAQKIQLFWAIIFAIFNVQRMPESQGGLLMKLGVKVALGIVRKPESRFKLWKKAESHMKKYDFESSKYVKELIASFRTMQCLYPRDRFTESKRFDFEDLKLPVHYYYKEYLSNAYHDYMKLPPIEKQVPKSDIVYINLDEGYKKYKGIYYCK